MTDTTLNRFLAYGTDAQRLAFSPSVPTPASGPSQAYLWYDTDTGAFYAYASGAWHALAGSGTVTSVATGAGLTGGTITSTGTLASLMPFEPGGRLTLTTAVPVLTSDVTSATTVYYALYKHSYVPIWDGSKTVPTLITELSQATTDNTKSPVACTTNSNYDVFIWNDSGTIRATRGPLWTSDTARGSGAGTTQITRNTDGYYTNTVAITNGPGAHLGTYVGTFRTNGSSQVDMKFGGTGAAGGESTNLGVWNYYNRIPTKLSNYDNTDTWTYTTATWRLKNAGASATANRITFIIGVNEDGMFARNSVCSNNSSSNVGHQCSIGLNSTSAWAVGQSSVGYSAVAGATAGSMFATFDAIAPLGFNYIAPLENSAATGTTTWYGDNGDNGSGTGVVNSIFTATIMA